MFAKKTQDANPGLQETIDKLTAQMAQEDPASDKYSKMVDQLTKLYAIQTTTRPDRLSKDALAAVAANLLGIAMILNHERAHVVATKALGFVSKLR